MSKFPHNGPDHISFSKKQHQQATTTIKPQFTKLQLEQSHNKSRLISMGTVVFHVLDVDTLKWDDMEVRFSNSFIITIFRFWHFSLETKLQCKCSLLNGDCRCSGMSVILSLQNTILILSFSSSISASQHHRWRTFFQNTFSYSAILLLSSATTSTAISSTAATTTSHYTAHEPNIGYHSTNGR
jgi:hypothetical protein